MKVAKDMRWCAEYDVIVLGFGGAGATAARFAADNGAQVLIVDAAPSGHEGGNTRYSAQHVAMAHDKKQITEYYQQLAAPFQVDENLLSTYLDGFVEMPKYFEKYFGLKPFIWSRDYQPEDHLANKQKLCEYPEYHGSTTFDFALVHNRDFDASLWQVLRKEVLKRKANIDIWLNSRAKHLLQNENGEVVGVKIERNHKEYFVHAAKGIVLATGGFENNHRMQQDYLHVDHLTPLGTLYNKGDGINMAAEVGAQMWHLSNYESLGIISGYVIAEGSNQRGHQISGWKNIKSGSIFAVANDGTRFMREDAQFRHGHIYQHGDYILPHAYDNAWLVFDQKQYEKFVQEQREGKLKYQNLFSKIISGQTVSQLAEQMSIPSQNLLETIKNFNDYARFGKDSEFGRSPASLEEFDLSNSIYGIKLAPAVLNTQGGPQRDDQARVLDTNGQPIARLYSAGELGGICSNRYQGGGNLAECLIFGKIAGENVVKMPAKKSSGIANQLPRINDLLSGDDEQIYLAKNQYLGSSEKGIGGKILVRVTYQDGIIKNVEVIENHETEGIGAVAIKQIPQEIVKHNSTKVDAISGASTTTNAIQEAVNSAIQKAKNLEGRKNVR